MDSDRLSLYLESNNIDESISYLEVLYREVTRSKDLELAKSIGTQLGVRFIKLFTDPKIEESKHLLIPIFFLFTGWDGKKYRKNRQLEREMKYDGPPTNVMEELSRQIDEDIFRDILQDLEFFMDISEISMEIAKSFLYQLVPSFDVELIDNSKAHHINPYYEIKFENSLGRLDGEDFYSRLRKLYPQISSKSSSTDWTDHLIQYCSSKEEDNLIYFSAASLCWKYWSQWTLAYLPTPHHKVVPDFIQNLQHNLLISNSFSDLQASQFQMFFDPLTTQDYKFRVIQGHILLVTMHNYEAFTHNPRSIRLSLEDQLLVHSFAGNFPSKNPTVMKTSVDILKRFLLNSPTKEQASQLCSLLF